VWNKLAKNHEWELAFIDRARRMWKGTEPPLDPHLVARHESAKAQTMPPWRTGSTSTIRPGHLFYDAGGKAPYLDILSKMYPKWMP